MSVVQDQNQLIGSLKHHPPQQKVYATHNNNSISNDNNNMILTNPNNHTDCSKPHAHLSPVKTQWNSASPALHDDDKSETLLSSPTTGSAGIFADRSSSRRMIMSAGRLVLPRFTAFQRKDPLPLEQQDTAVLRRHGGDPSEHLSPDPLATNFVALEPPQPEQKRQDVTVVTCSMCKTPQDWVQDGPFHCAQCYGSEQDSSRELLSAQEDTLHALSNNKVIGGVLETIRDPPLPRECEASENMHQYHSQSTTVEQGPMTQETSGGSDSSRKSSSSMVPAIPRLSNLLRLRSSGTAEGEHEAGAALSSEPQYHHHSPHPQSSTLTRNTVAAEESGDESGRSPRRIGNFVRRLRGSVSTRSMESAGSFEEHPPAPQQPSAEEY